ncbi:MAG: protein kinase domain-containing protein [Planctomycetota bacterium]
MPLAGSTPGFERIGRRRFANDPGGSGSFDYTLLRRIGWGGLGEVRLAWQASLNRTVAIKRLHSSVLPEARQRLIREAVVGANLTHPNIVTVHDVACDTEGTVFYVMRRAEGHPWSDVIQRLSRRENIDKLLRVSDAVSFAHAAGVVHRDLKPANVMIGDHDEVLVMDWGMAVSPPGTVEPIAEVLPRLTPPAGTPAYMAPEMARGEGWLIDRRSDIYLLGAILFEILTGFPPHEETGSDDLLAAARANHIRDSRQGGELMEIARRALSTDPHARHCSVREFRDAVAAHDRHAESRELAGRAQQAFDRAAVSGDYELFNRAIFGFEAALELWDNNASAREHLSRARRSYAAFALGRDDLDLAASLLDPDDPAHGDMLGRLSAARERRRREQAAEAELEVLEQRISGPVEPDWQCVCHEQFTDEHWRDRWRVIGGTGEVVDGELRVTPGMPSLVVYELPVRGNVRIGFEVRILDGRPNDLSCMLACRSDSSGDHIFMSGYEFKFASFDNSLACCYRNSICLRQQPCEPVVRDRVYRVSVARIDAELRMSVDGREVFRIHDPEPITAPEHDRIGLFGWDCTYAYRDIRIEILNHPFRVDVLDLAESHLSRGNYGTAVDLFAEVEDHPAAARAQRARHGAQRARTMAVQRDGLQDYRARLGMIWPGVQVAVGGIGLNVDLAMCGVEDLEPLRGMPINQLDLGCNAVRDLSPLAGMPLARLYAPLNRISDLSPLAGMPLERLDIGGNVVCDLGPLADCPLRMLYCSFNRISELAPLASMPLAYLFAQQNVIADLAPLAGMSLRSIALGNNEIVDISALAEVTVDDLLLQGNRIGDLTGIANKQYNMLYLGCNRIEDVRPLGTARVGRLDLSDNRVERIGCLLAQQFQSCWLGSNPLAPGERDRLARCWADQAAMRPSLGQLEAEDAIADGDIAALRWVGQDPTVGDRLFRLARPVAWGESERITAALGCQVACMSSDEEATAFTSCVGRLNQSWVGLRHGDTAWGNGVPVAAGLPRPEQGPVGAPLVFWSGMFYPEPDPEHVHCIVLNLGR